MSKFSGYFVKSNGINLNAGTVSATPLPVLERIREYQWQFEANPAAGWFNIWGKLWQTQTKLAQFFSMQPTDMFLRTNVTEACNDFILGVELAQGDLVATNLEYGAIINVLRFRGEREGRRFRTIDIPTQPKTSQEIVNAVLAGLDSETRLLLISHVTTGSGLIMPIPEIARVTRERGIVLVVDGAHAPGSLELNFSELVDVDFYGGNFHKWMMGPKGSGFGWVPKWRQPFVRATQAGWTSYDTPEVFRVFGGGDEFALRMLRAHSFNFSTYLALADMVDFWELHGREAIRLQQLKLRARLRENMKEFAEFTPTHSSNEALCASLSSYRLPHQIAHDLSLNIGRIFEETQISVNLPVFAGNRHLRLSPGIWVSEAEVDEGIARLMNYLCKRL